MATPRRPRARPRRPPDTVDRALAGLAGVALVASGVAELAAADCTDDEIAAHAALRGWAVDHGASGWRLWIGLHRLAGMAALRCRVQQVALGGSEAPKGQAPVAVWLTRQRLGYTGAGVDAIVRARVLALSKLDRSQLISALERQLQVLRSAGVPAVTAGETEVVDP